MTINLETQPYILLENQMSFGFDRFHLAVLAIQSPEISHDIVTPKSLFVQVVVTQLRYPFFCK